jgi:hypothetical protein
MGIVRAVLRLEGSSQARTWFKRNGGNMDNEAGAERLAEFPLITVATVGGGSASCAGRIGLVMAQLGYGLASKPDHDY